MKYSTGRGTKLRHSTAIEWDELEKKKKKRGYHPIKFSTGGNAAIKHATGTEFDWKAMRDHHKVRSKPILEDDKYLELHQKVLSRSMG